MENTAGNFATAFFGGPRGFLLAEAGIHQRAHLSVHAHRLGEPLLRGHPAINRRLDTVGFDGLILHDVSESNRLTVAVQLLRVEFT